ncbi:sec1 family domain-containing protein 2-like [Glandiceps talaboti]
MATGIRSILSCSKASWEDVYEKVKKAVVFIDNACAECLHWNGGAIQLFGNGAAEVKEFSSFESANASYMKGVFIVSTPLIGQTANTIRDIITASHFQYCIVITATTPEVHYFTRKENHDPNYENKIFENFEEHMLHWMGNVNYTAEVLSVPIISASVCHSLFIMPSYASFFPLTSHDAERLQLYRRHLNEKKTIDSLADLEFYMLPFELQSRIKMFVCSLSSLFDMLKVSEDCYAVGATSRIIASELAALQSAKTRRKNAVNKASIVLIDRTLDLVGSTGHHGETLADKVISLLPRLPGHSSDVSVNMADLCSEGSQYSSEVVVPGCLAHPGDGFAHSLLNTMITSKQKECLMDINRHLVEAASEENLPLQLTGRLGRINAGTLESHLKLFKGNKQAFINHSGLLQIAMATIKTLKHDKYAMMEKLQSIEKMIMLNTGDSDCPSALSQIKQLMESENNYDVEDLLLLLVFVYSLEGGNSSESEDEEREVQKALVQAILGKDEHADNIRYLVGYQPTEDSVRRGIQKFFQKLTSIGEARNHLKQFRSIFESQGFQGGYKSLLKQIIDDIFNPAKPDLVDIEYKSSGLKDLLKSGFGMFMKVSKPRPNDHPLLILFVVGGVTCSEVRLIREAVSSYKPSTQVIIGSTSIVKSADIIHHAFTQDNLFPDEL